MPMGLPHNTIVDGNSMVYVQDSNWPPTVVFESGLGDGFSTWADVYSKVQAFAGVFAYSRPGYSAGMRRPESGGERTADESAKLLREILAKSDSPAPYILVGHSIGGLYVLEFARDYPELVAGLILVDARLPGFTEKCELAEVGPCLPPASSALMLPPHIAAEIQGIQSSEANAPLSADIGNIPTILIAATKPPPGASSDAQTVWLSVQKEFADSLTDGDLVIAEGSGHYVQKDAPQIVVDEIRHLITSIRSNDI